MEQSADRETKGRAGSERGEMKVYLASNYSTWPDMQVKAAQLKYLGHEVTSEWITGAHNGDDRAEYAAIDLRDIDEAEAVIFFSESPEGSRTRGGKHVEFGYALARGKQIFLVGPPVNVFHHLPQVVQRLKFEDLLWLF
jgi:nucleoside 2-deoxyribosyltransferase